MTQSGTGSWSKIDRNVAKSVGRLPEYELFIQKGQKYPMRPLTMIIFDSTKGKSL